MYAPLNKIQQRLSLNDKEAHYKVFLSATYYPKFVSIFVPNVPYKKKKPNIEAPLKQVAIRKRSKEDEAASKELNSIRSIRRTKRSVKDYALLNEFDMFATFTFSPKKSDRLNPDAVKKQMNNWLKNQQKRVGKFTYLIIPEFHKDGRALHFHALFKGYKGNLTETKHRTKAGRIIHTIDGYSLGWNSVVMIDSVDQVANYIRKYITKDMPRFHGKHRFWSSKGLSKPKTIDNPEIWYEGLTPIFTHENQHGTLFYFDNLEGKGDEERLRSSTREACAKLGALLITALFGAQRV